MRNYSDWIRLKKNKEEISLIIKYLFAKHGLYFNGEIEYINSSNIVCKTGEYCIKLYTPQYILRKYEFEYEKESMILSSSRNYMCTPNVIAEGLLEHPLLNYIIMDARRGIEINQFLSYGLERKIKLIKACYKTKTEVLNSINENDIGDKCRVRFYSIPFKKSRVKTEIINEVLFREPMNKIIHCDLKWDNYLIDEYDAVTLLDYGDTHIGPESVDLAVFYMRFIRKDPQLSLLINKMGKKAKRIIIQGICYHPFCEALIEEISNEHRIDYSLINSLNDLYTVL